MARIGWWVVALLIAPLAIAGCGLPLGDLGSLLGSGGGGYGGGPGYGGGYAGGPAYVLPPGGGGSYAYAPAPAPYVMAPGYGGGGAYVAGNVTAPGRPPYYGGPQGPGNYGPMAGQRFGSGPGFQGGPNAYRRPYAMGPGPGGPGNSYGGRFQQGAGGSPGFQAGANTYAVSSPRRMAQRPSQTSPVPILRSRRRGSTAKGNGVRPINPKYLGWLSRVG